MCGTFGQQKPKLCQIHLQNNYWSQLPVLSLNETQVWFLIFLISFLCFSAKSISSVVFLVNKHQNLVKCPTKTSFKPNCSFYQLMERKFGFRSFVICFLCFSAKSIPSVLLLDSKHQKLVKCPTKTSFKPDCSF